MSSKFEQFGFTAEDYERIPRKEDGWTQERMPETHFTLRIKSVRFSGGSSCRYYLQVEKPETKREREQLRRKALALIEAIAKENAAATVRRERRVLQVRGKRR